MSLLEDFARVAAGCLGRVAFIAFTLVFLALYINYNGPVM